MKHIKSFIQTLDEERYTDEEVEKCIKLFIIGIIAAAAGLIVRMVG